MKNETSKRIALIAEDEVLLRSIAAEFLAEAGFDVLEANDGEEALILLQTNSEISLLVSDVRMPRMDGYVLTRAALDLQPGLKVILMTGYSDDIPNYIPRDKIHMFHKPFEFEKLTAVANELVQQQSDPKWPC